MAVPSEALGTLLDASSAIASDVSVYPGPANQLQVPAIVIRPDDPWITPGPTYCLDEQQYVAIAVVTASSPREAMQRLYDIARGIISSIDTEDSAWSFTSVSAPVIDETTGSAFLAAAVHLTYRNTEEEAS